MRYCQLLATGEIDAFLLVSRRQSCAIIWLNYAKCTAAWHLLNLAYELAYELAVKNNGIQSHAVISPTWHDYSNAGVDWFNGFMKRPARFHSERQKRLLWVGRRVSTEWMCLDAFFCQFGGCKISLHEFHGCTTLSAKKCWHILTRQWFLKS